MSADLIEAGAPRCDECGMPLSMHHDPGCSQPCGACKRAGPQHAATQALWFTPRQLREAARKGGITVRAEVTGDYLTLVWVYGVPEGTAPGCHEAAE